MDMGGDELFRYTDAILTYWNVSGNSRVDLPYVDYQVVRLWEDIQDHLPHILEPVPDRILQHVRPGMQGLLWHDRMLQALLLETKHDSDSAYDLLDLATSWLNQRWLDVGYLQYGPRIWFWTEDQQVIIHWDNSELRIDDIPVWTATTGSYTMPIQAFIDEVRSFDKRLIQAMQDRVAAIQQQWNRPDVQIDLPALQREQQDRASWLERTFDRARHMPQTPWNEVLKIAERLERGDLRS